jgi:hypothetical protein
MQKVTKGMPRADGSNSDERVLQLLGKLHGLVRQADNLAVLYLIRGKPFGILPLLEQQLRLGKRGSDANFLQSLAQYQDGSAFSMAEKGAGEGGKNSDEQWAKERAPLHLRIERARSGTAGANARMGTQGTAGLFSIAHYGTPFDEGANGAMQSPSPPVVVSYQAPGMLAKNNDSVSRDVLDIVLEGIETSVVEAQQAQQAASGAGKLNLLKLPLLPRLFRAANPLAFSTKCKQAGVEMSALDLRADGGAGPSEGGGGGSEGRSMARPSVAGRRAEKVRRTYALGRVSGGEV